MMKTNIKKFMTVFLMVVVTQSSYAQFGILDPSFNGTGISITTSGYACAGMALQSDGKILLGGTVYNSNPDFGVVRLNSDGSMDNTFGLSGVASAPVGLNADLGRAIAVQSDGKILITGGINNGTNQDLGVLRFKTDGSVDSTFGTFGFATVVTGPGDDVGRAIAVQSDGKIVVAGHGYNGTKVDFIVVRFNSDGSLDNTFSGTGAVSTAFGASTFDEAYSMAIQPDGKIVVAGNSNWKFALARYNTNGSLDNTFGTGGLVVTPIGTSTDELKNITLQADGKIVAVGFGIVGSFRDAIVVRYNSNGLLDNTFGTSGIVVTSVGTKNDMAYGVDIQSDGKIVIAGESEPTSPSQNIFVARYDSTGVLDPTFGTGGIAIEAPSGSYDFVATCLLDASEKIVVAGTFGNYFAAARFIGNCITGNITTQPSSTTLCEGNNALFQVASSGFFGYQWQENSGSGFVNMPGQTNATLNLNSVVAAMDGYTYRCILNELCGNTDTTVVATLDISTVNSNVTQTGINLSADLIGATYQWLDCNASFSSVSGATSQVFIPTVNGSYAVMITTLGCIDTSSCYNVTTIGVEEHQTEAHFNASPNPFTDYLSIDFDANQIQYSMLNVYSMDGRLFLSFPVENEKTIISTNEWSSGLYILELITENENSEYKRIIKTK